jgi:ferredoxin
VIPGIHTGEELKEDVVDVLKNRNFSEADRKKLDANKSRCKKYCHACGYCVSMGNGCPRNINIFYFLALDGYFRLFGPKGWIIDLYKKQKVKPDACIYCGHCESVCPYALPIMRILRDLQIRKHLDKTGYRCTNKFGKRNFHEEKKELDETARKQLGKNWMPPVVCYAYKRGSNPGQRATVLKLINEFEKYANKEQKKNAIRLLCKEMKIENKNIHMLKDLAMLSDYDNVVDIMRILPLMTRKIRKK